jgi:hypothetical protein
VVRVKAGHAGREPFLWELQPTALQDQDDQVLPLLLAREALWELEDRYHACSWETKLAELKRLTRDLLGSCACSESRQSEPTEAESLKGRILEISKKYGILSSLTSFLVVAERPGAEAGEIALRRIPVALTRGRGGMEPGFATHYSRSSVRSSHVKLYKSEFDSPEFRALRRPVTRYPLQVPLSPAPDQTEQDFRRLIQEQQAGGWWSLNPWLAQQVGSSVQALKKASKKLVLPSKTAHQVVATLTALYLLKTHFPEWEDEWRLTAAKAERWLKSQNIPPPSPGPIFLAWLEEALSRGPDR